MLHKHKHKHHLLITLVWCLEWPMLMTNSFVVVCCVWRSPDGQHLAFSIRTIDQVYLIQELIVQRLNDWLFMDVLHMKETHESGFFPPLSSSELFRLEWRLWHMQLILCQTRFVLLPSWVSYLDQFCCLKHKNANCPSHCNGLVVFLRKHNHFFASF